jgi:hypothetical protein
MKIKRGSTSVRRLIFIADTSKTDGSGLANLVYNSSGLVAYYFAGDLADEVQITLASATLGTWTSGGFIAVDNTNMPGWYELGIPNAALDGGNEVAIQLRGAANMAPVNVYIELDTVDYQTDAFGALRPTTAGRTLDVTATGAAGIDWANVENPTTTVALTNTTINAAPIADAVWDEAYNQHTTAGTFGKLMDILRKSNTVLEGTILASPIPTTTVFRLSGIDYPTGALEHSILWMNSGTSQNQNSPILTTVNNGDGTVTVTLEEALVTAPVAGDTVLIDPTSHVHTVSEIQGTMPDRLGYLLSILAGAISDAGTAAETYTITLGANTFTVDYSGLDATGNRTGATLTKT